ncbi:MAG TPA: GntG family PLP-dependent aldolase [Candidatus Sulfotelmatobacter sp.]|jgi:threonine aldolase|nr:GntG family PLP-dependent aldolase [Candidatus Sulfotelmatobacter sp.]
MGGVIDLRSDTVTKPSAAMRRAMAEAEVGDDVYGEDPTVARLQEEAAAAVGFPAALFVPTGTMGNEIAVQLLARRGTEAIVDADSHIYNYELAAMAAGAGVLPRVLRGTRGAPDADEVEIECRPKPYYDAPVSLLLLENTHNHAGGTVLPQSRKAALLDAARRHGVRAHLDGARIFNAATALSESAAAVASGFDSVMFCLSKGLGAPVGSMLCASAELIREARVIRKRLGGGMRQAGVIAAAGLVALRENRERLADDHVRAKRLAEALAATRGFRIDPAEVETNMVIVEVDPPERAEAVIEDLKARGVLAGMMGYGRVRFVTHLDVDDAGIERAIRALRARA